MSSSSSSSTFTIFGATGGTGRHFTLQSLSAGYHVRALIRNPQKAEELSHENFHLIFGSITDSTIDFTKLLKGSEYVIVMLSDREAQKTEKINLTFIKRLVPAMRENGVKKLLYQAGGLSKPPEKNLTLFLWTIRNTVARSFIGQHQDNEAVMEYLFKEAKDIDWIVHRAGIYSDGPSKGLLIRSNSNFSIATFKDCADYSFRIVSDPSAIHTFEFSTYQS